MPEDTHVPPTFFFFPPVVAMVASAWQPQS